MFNGDAPLPTLTTEIIQKYLEENQELIMAIVERRNRGKFAEAAQCLSRLQVNLTDLTQLADAAAQAQTNSQGQGMQMQHPPPPHIAMSQQQQDFSTLCSPFDMNEQLKQHHRQQQQQWQQQHHLAMSPQQSDISNSRLAVQMNEQQHKVPGFLQQQQQLISGPMVGNIVGTSSGMYQAVQARETQ